MLASAGTEPQDPLLCEACCVVGLTSLEGTIQACTDTAHITCRA